MKYRVREKLKKITFGILLLGMIGGLTYTVHYALNRDFSHYEKDREEKSANIKKSDTREVLESVNKKDETTSTKKQEETPSENYQEEDEKIPVVDVPKTPEVKEPAIVATDQNKEPDIKENDDVPNKQEEPVKDVSFVCNLEMSAEDITVANTVSGKANGNTKIFDSLSMMLVYDLSSVEEVNEEYINEIIAELEDPTMEMEGFARKINSDALNKKVSISYVADETFLKADSSKKYDEYIDTLKSDGYSCVIS